MNAFANRPDGQPDSHPKRRRGGAMACPHCDGPLRIRSSVVVTALSRHLQLQCVDLECGATFGADLGITHAISPSAQPNPQVILRQAPPRRRPVNDNIPVRHDAPSGPGVPPANDPDGAVTATG